MGTIIQEDENYCKFARQCPIQDTLLESAKSGKGYHLPGLCAHLITTLQDLVEPEGVEAVENDA